MIRLAVAAGAAYEQCAVAGIVVKKAAASPNGRILVGIRVQRPLRMLQLTRMMDAVVGDDRALPYGFDEDTDMPGSMAECRQQALLVADAVNSRPPYRVTGRQPIIFMRRPTPSGSISLWFTFVDKARPEFLTRRRSSGDSATPASRCPPMSVTH